MRLELLSERVAPTGSASADGLKKVMGAPALDRLSVVVREAVQNSWDARLREPGDPGIRVHFNYRSLTGPQAERLRSAIGQDLPESSFGNDLSRILNDLPLTVLEIADYGTVGLAGPEHADDPVAPGQPTHFVDFIRNVGKTHEQVEGGTYGFGKASFYALSKASTIYIDSITTNSGTPVRRAMFAGLGERYTETVDGASRNFTGRHWWGTRLDVDRIAPLRDNAATLFAETLGLPERTSSDRGTTIGILAPRLNSEEVDGIAKKLMRSILLNFWPKMVPVEEAGVPAIQFSLSINGQAYDIPRPESSPPFTHFVTALRAVRSAAEQDPMTGSVITGGSPRVCLGRMSLQAGPLMARPPGLLLESDSEDAGHALFRTEPISHIAEMRSGELVVRYVRQEPLANPEWEWAGVFRTTADETVERAFALSEPPTHDAWNVSSLADPEHQRWLRSYTMRKNQRVRDFLAPRQVPAPSGESLGRASASLGALLPGMTVANGRSPFKSRRAGSGKAGRRGRFSVPKFREHLILNDAAAAKFEIKWFPADSSPETLILRVLPQVLLEGRLVNTTELPPGLKAPRILDLKASGSTRLERLGAAYVRFPSRQPFNLIISVTLENNLPSGVSVSLAETDGI